MIWKIALILSIGVAIYLGWFFTIIFMGQTGNTTPVIVDIKQSESVSDVMMKLEEKDLLDSELAFKVYLKFSELDKQIKPGSYQLNGTMSIQQIVEELISGVSYNEKSVTFLEGWNLRQVAEYLIQQEFIETPEELYEYTGYPAQVFHGTNDALHQEYDFLDVVPSGYSLEGFIFPDTYRVFEDASVETILTKALDNFHRKFSQEINDELEKTDMEFYDVMKLASIVVKEAKTFEDKRRVAGVFLNRLEIGMGLQSDPTVNYVTLKVTDNPSLEDIATESQYNTYKYTGLPPTPISNPGLEDILAVLNPIEHDYFFFLNTKQGEMIFSKDFEEHKANRVKYGQ